MSAPQRPTETVAARLRSAAAIAAAAVALAVASTAACSSGDGAGGPDSQATDPTPPAAEEALVGDLVFTEVSAQAGLDEVHSSLGLLGESDMTSGVAVADVDGDGYLDVFVPRVGRPNSLYLNNGDGTFTDVAREAGVAGPTDRFGSSTAAFLDVDGDGHLDLFVAGAGRGANELYVNDGTGRFTEQAAARGLTWPELDEGAEARHHGVAVADVDGDGHLDLLVLQWYSELYNGEAISAAAAAAGWEEGESPGPCETADALAAIGFPTPEGTPATRSALFINDGDGSFSDRTEDFELPLDEIVAFTGVFADLDDSGWPDLAITGDGCTTRLFRNDEGRRFVDVTDDAGVGTDENGMGSVVRDLDGDGRPDWFITSIGRAPDGSCSGGGFFGCSGNRVHLNQGNLRFRDATDELGLREGGWGWGAAIEDFSNDGRLEVVMANGYDVGTGSDGFLGSFSADPTRFWVLDGERYVEVAAAVGIDDTSVGHALVAFDMDNDGDLDLLVVPSGDETPRLYRNDTPSGRAWLTVSLDDPTTPGNRWGDGARIEVVVDEGDDPVVGWISTSGSYETQRPPVFHAGFGDRDRPLHRVRVRWPHGGDVDELSDVELRQQLRITRS